ncbi:phage tail tape measure protein [Metapseudomonas furukawaii]|uniref:phage tail tape measure protein n=1 Tax=Metapseudomonas furukawaii TaxID=1149133 RepID=UPI004045BDCF
MSSELRVAIRIAAQAGNSKREIQDLNSTLRAAGREGARSLADESWRAQGAMRGAGQAGAASFQLARTAIRQAASDGLRPLREEAGQASAAVKAVGRGGTRSGREVTEAFRQAERAAVRGLRESLNQTDNGLKRLARTGLSSMRTLKTVAAGVREEFSRVRNLVNSTGGKLASLGIGIGVGQQFGASARLDRQMIRTQQTAEMTPEHREEWRAVGMQAGRRYGVDPDAIYAGGDALLAGGLSYKATLASADAMAQASAVTGADSQVLAGALKAGSAMFNINLEQGGTALDMLQKMTIAGRLGSAELENIADLLPRIGGNARAAGMDLSQALAFTETLSNMEQDPARLGTLTESTLRIFANPQYRQQITKSTGVQFFNADGTSRDSQHVYADLKRKYARMQTDEERAKFMGVVFKGMDQDTQRGNRYLLDADNLETFASHTQSVRNAGAPFQQDLQNNIRSATGTAGRMRATLREAMDRMAQPVNKALADTGSYLLDDLNLSGGQLLAGGTAATIGGYYAGRGAKALGGKVMGKLEGLLGNSTNPAELMRNLVVGRALEQAAGVTPVFVTNWPSGIGGLGAGPRVERDAGRTAGLLREWGGLAGGYALRAAPWAALVGGTLVLSGSSDNSDEAQLANLDRAELTPGQREYRGAYLRQRIALADQQPDLDFFQLNREAAHLAQQETGLTAYGAPVAAIDQRMQDLTARLMGNLQGGPQGGKLLRALPKPAQKSDLAERLNARLMGNLLADMAPAGAQNFLTWSEEQAAQLPTAPSAGPLAQSTPAAQAQVLDNFARKLGELLGKPLVIQVQTDSDVIAARVERRAGIQMRRGQ